MLKLQYMETVKVVPEHLRDEILLRTVDGETVELRRMFLGLMPLEADCTETGDEKETSLCKNYLRAVIFHFGEFELLQQ